jgi:transposase
MPCSILAAIATALVGSMERSCIMHRAGRAPTGMDRQTLRDWVHRFDEVGVAGLLSRRSPGPTPKLSERKWLNCANWLSRVLIRKGTGSCVGAAVTCARR